MKRQTTKSVFSRSTRGSVATSGPIRRPRNRVSRGQSAVEFALISVLALAVMLVGIQYALIGQAAVAVSQGSSALARYAASNVSSTGALGTNNGTVKASALPAAAQEVLSQSILTNGGNDLTVTINSYTSTGAVETGTPQLQSDQLVINLSYVTTSKLAVPNPFLAIPPLFPGITFPATVAATDSQMYEN
jgi:Flp pilus assembly protein TadG